jgi:hypothetical protein
VQEHNPTTTTTTTTMSTEYYNCLALPEELERLVWFFKEKLEKKEHKWKMANCSYDIKNINWGSPWAGGNLWIFDEINTEHWANLEFSYDKQKDIYMELLGDTLEDFKEPEEKRLRREHKWNMSSVLYKIKEARGFILAPSEWLEGLE